MDADKHNQTTTELDRLWSIPYVLSDERAPMAAIIVRLEPEVHGLLTRAHQMSGRYLHRLVGNVHVYDFG